jgi:DNA-binding FadR family transcriptional regulator
MMALSRAIYTATATEGFVNEEVRETTQRAHRSVTKAIRDRDAEAAARRMTRHVHPYAKSVMEFEKRTEIPLDTEE